MALVYAFAYPIANTAVLNLFVKLQEVGTDESMQSHFALAGSMSRVIFPVMAGYFEVYVKFSASFALVLMLICSVAIAVLFLQKKINRYTITADTVITDVMAIGDKFAVGVCVAGILIGFICLIGAAYEK